MRCVGLIFLFYSIPAIANIASTNYIRESVKEIWGINLTDTIGTIASEKYLMNMLDIANGTNYANSVTENVIAQSKADRIFFAFSLIHSSAPANSFLTLDKVNQHIPPTDITQWREIACSRHQGQGINLSNPASINNATGFITGTIGPGVYMFISNNKTSSSQQNLSNIIIFAHPVGFKIVHNGTWEVYHVFIDTNHANFQSYNLTNASWDIANYTNISNLVAGTPAQICIYELK
jgi:hypothetical protein